MNNPVSIKENNTHKLIWDFGRHTDRLILARRPDLIIIKSIEVNMRNCRLCSSS